MPNGIPSHDTFRRVLLLLKAEELETAFLSWMKSAVERHQGCLVSIAGKALRGSQHSSDKAGAWRMVAAWATEQAVVLGQIKTEEKSNEITAIPELLKVLDLSGCIVTIDAVGCQTEIVEQIKAQGGDYVISLKGNPGRLPREVKDYLDWAERIGFAQIEFDYYETLEKGHGRLERRLCWVSEEIEWLESKEKWSGRRSVVMVESEREIIGGEQTVERRLFISSLEANARQALRAMRGHWGIENELHWCLDIAFREDACRIRSGEAAANLAVIRHISLRGCLNFQEVENCFYNFHQFTNQRIWWQPRPTAVSY